MVEPFINLAEVFVNGSVWKKRGSLRTRTRAPSLSRALRYCSRFVYLIGPESYIRARELDVRIEIYYYSCCKYILKMIFLNINLSLNTHMNDYN